GGQRSPIGFVEFLRQAVDLRLQAVESVDYAADVVPQGAQNRRSTLFAPHGQILQAGERTVVQFLELYGDRSQQRRRLGVQRQLPVAELREGFLQLVRQRAGLRGQFLDLRDA